MREYKHLRPEVQATLSRCRACFDNSIENSFTRFGLLSQHAQYVKYCIQTCKTQISGTTICHISQSINFVQKEKSYT